MATALIVNASPYGTETPYDALRPAGAVGTIHDLVAPTLRSDRTLTF